MTPKLKELPIGAYLKISNHLGNFKMNRINEIQNIYLLAAGTGITPMCKLIQSIYRLSKKDKKSRHVLLLNFNKTQDDIIWRHHFKALEDNTNEEFTFKIVHILSQEEKWEGDKGRIRKELLEMYLEKKNGFKKIAFICGPIFELHHNTLKAGCLDSRVHSSDNDKLDK